MRENPGVQVMREWREMEKRRFKISFYHIPPVILGQTRDNEHQQSFVFRPAGSSLKKKQYLRLKVCIVQRGPSTYVSQEQFIGFSIRYPDFRSSKSLSMGTPGYGEPPGKKNNKKNNSNKNNNKTINYVSRKMLLYHAITRDSLHSNTRVPLCPRDC